MAGNSWLWPRLIAVFAASQVLIFTPALAQDENAETAVAENPAPLAKTALRNLRLAALGDPEYIAVQWRYLSDGETIKTAPALDAPELLISGVKTEAPVLTSFTNQNVESVIVIVVSGKSANHAEYYYETAKSAVSALPNGAYRILIANDGKAFNWVSDIKSATDGENLDWAEVFKNVELEFTAAQPKTSALVRAFADSMQVLKQASPQSRVAILVPEALFPTDPELLKQLADAAYAQRISFFPMRPQDGVSPARAQQMNDIAGPTAGRFLPDALTGRTLAERLALFSEFLSGSSAVYHIAPHYKYALPGESVDPVTLTVNYGDLTDTLTLPHDRPVLTGAKLVKTFLNPAHWMNWLTDGNRWPYGLAALGFWLIVLGSIYRLLVPPVKLYVQLAGEDDVQKIRRLPAMIGRGNHAHINLDDEGVSREHAEVRRDGKHLVLNDLGSANGTWIGGERVKSAPLKSVQTVQIGQVRLILRQRRVRVPVKTVTANGGE